MTHPTNKRDRFLKGVNKGNKRANAHLAGMTPTDKQKHKEFMERAKHLHRDTTKLCSCSMCCNKRKIEGETLQEQRAKIETDDEA